MESNGRILEDAPFLWFATILDFPDSALQHMVIVHICHTCRLPCPNLKHSYRMHDESSAGLSGELIPRGAQFRMSKGEV